MSTAVDLIRRIRRRTGDRPVRVLVQDNPLTAGAAVLTIRAGDVEKFRSSGVEMCFDDGTDEFVVTSAAADSTANTVAIDRAQDGTTAAEHLLNVAALLRPRFDNAILLDQINYVIEDELWPSVWIAKESSLAYQAINEYFSPTVSDIEELVYAYQIVSGFVTQLHAEYLSAELADDVNFPNGAIIIRRTADSSTIYFAYRARPTLATLTTALEHLVVLGAASQAMLAEEDRHTGGSTTAVERSVQDGSRLRAGSVGWNAFTNARMLENVRLQHQEQLARRKFFRAGVG